MNEQAKKFIASIVTDRLDGWEIHSWALVDKMRIEYPALYWKYIISLPKPIHRDKKKYPTEEETIKAMFELMQTLK